MAIAGKGIGGIGRFSRSLALGAGIATARFPVSVLLVFAISAVANLEIAGIGLLDDADLVWLVSALSAALAASVAVRLSGESRGWGPSWLGLVPLLCALAAGLLVWYADPLSILAPPLVAALTLSIPLAPYILRPDDKRFWAFTLWTSVGVALAFLSVMLFILGVSAILEMIRYLFGIGLSGDAYEHIYATALTLVGPLFALGRIPRAFDETVTSLGDDRLTAGVRFLFDWVGAPLALATAAVLHLYAAKIVFVGEVPKSEIGWIVSFYAVLVLSFRVAAEPFIENGATTTRAFGRLWAAMLVVPVGLLAYAAGLRILAEGFTLERYYLALGALAAAIVILAQLAPRLRGDIRFIAGVPLALLALSCFGPWGAAGTVGRSQTALIAAAAGTPFDVAALDDGEKAVLRSRIDALREVGEVERILPLLPEPQRNEIAGRASGRPDGLATVVVDVLGLGYATPPAPGNTAAIFAATRALPLDLTGFDTALPEQSVVQADTSVPPFSQQQVSADTEAALVFLDGSELVVRYSGVEDRFDLKAGLDGLRSAVAVGSQDIAPAILDLVSGSSRRMIRTRITWASLGTTLDEPLALTMTILLDRREWRASP